VAGFMRREGDKNSRKGRENGEEKEERNG